MTEPDPPSEKRTEQITADLKRLGEDLDKIVTPADMDLVNAMTRVRARELHELHDQAPPLAELPNRTRDWLQILITACEQPPSNDMLAMADLMAEKDIELLQTAHNPKPRRRRLSLKNPKQIMRAIAAVTADLQDGTIQPAHARAQLYALQTLLVAMRMHAESESPESPAQPLQLEAVASPSTPGLISTGHHLMHLQHMTAEDPGAKE